MIDSDNSAHMAGYTEQYIAYFGDFDLHISVYPGTDTDGRFFAFNHDEQGLIIVNGWTCTLEKVEG